MREWISVKDGLPEIGVEVLICDVNCSNGYRDVWSLEHDEEYDDFCWEDKNGNWHPLYDVTHWMPLPSPPGDKVVEIDQVKPLTLDELREMDGDKIYIQFIGFCKGFYDDEYAPYYGRNEQYIQKYNGMLRACDLPLKYYGKSWLAYRRKPEEGTR